MKLFILIFPLYLISCTENKMESSNDSTINIIEQKSNYSPIEDSTNLVKAYENIYFGSKRPIELGRKSIIANMPFEYKGGAMYKDYGLYNFGLESEPICDYNSCLQIIDDIKKMITIKYENPRRFKVQKEPTEHSEFDKLFLGDKIDEALPPGDNFNNKLFEWKKNDITIELATTTFYRKNDGTEPSIYCPTSEEYQKFYLISIDFKYDKISRLIEEQNKKELQEINENHKEQLQNDSKKF
jgi:hypothetical protein